MRIVLDEEGSTTAFLSAVGAAYGMVIPTWGLALYPWWAFQLRRPRTDDMRQMLDDIERAEREHPQPVVVHFGIDWGRE